MRKLAEWSKQIMALGLIVTKADLTYPLLTVT